MSDDRDELQSVFDGAFAPQVNPARVALTTAAGLDPDRGADRQRVARELRLPVPFVRDNEVEAQRIIRQRALAAQADKIRRTAPRTSQFLGDASRAAIAQDDIGVMAQIERLVVGVPKAIGRSLAAGVAGFGRQAYGAAQSYVDWQESADVTAPLQRQLFGGTIYDTFQCSLGSAAEASQATMDAWRPKVVNRYARAALHGVESHPTSLGAMELAMMGRPDAGAAVLGGATYGGPYLDARKQGMPGGKAALYGATQGGIEILTERIPLAKFLADTKAASPLLRRLFNNLVAENATEQVATASQDLVAWAALPDNADKSFGDYLKERPDAALDTLIATTAAIGGSNAGVAVVEAVGRRVEREAQVAETTRRQDAITELIQLSTASRYRGRDQEGFREFVQHIVEEESVNLKDFYVSHATLGNVFNQSASSPSRRLARRSRRRPLSHSEEIPDVASKPDRPCRPRIRDH